MAITTQLSPYWPGALAPLPPTQLFMLVGILPLIPIMRIYNGYQYLVFSGKVDGTA